MKRYEAQITIEVEEGREMDSIEIAESISMRAPMGVTIDVTSIREVGSAAFKCDEL